MSRAGQAEFTKRYEPDDDGLRYQDLVYTGNFVGMEPVVDGTKGNCVHDWCLGAVAFGMGRCGLLALEVMDADDYVEESNIILKFMQRVLWGKRQDGLILNSQDRYRCQIHDQSIIDQVMNQVENFEPGSEKAAHFTQFNATAELLAFFDHYDCRLRLGHTGPYPLPDGRLLIIRDLFTNEDVFHWSDICAGLP